MSTIRELQNKYFFADYERNRLYDNYQDTLCGFHQDETQLPQAYTNYRNAVEACNDAKLNYFEAIHVWETNCKQYGGGYANYIDNLNKEQQ